MKLNTTPARAGATILIISSSYLMLTAFSGGITNRTQKSGTLGCNCHGSSPTGTVSVSILGPEALTAGQTEIYTVSISGGPLGAAGTDIAASSGGLNIIGGQGLRKEGDELVHSGPKSPELGTVSFQFSFTAPAESGTATLYATGNSVNFDGSTGGDEWNFSLNRTITITPATSVEKGDVPVAFALQPNYPNPFNPSTTIEFTLPAKSPARLEVYTLAGERVATLLAGDLAAGHHQRQFDASRLASGVYLYRLVAGPHSATRAMTLAR